MSSMDNYYEAINYEKIGDLDGAYIKFQRDNVDVSLSKLVLYNFFGKGCERSYKTSLEYLNKISSKSEKLFLTSYLLLLEKNRDFYKYYEGLEKASELKNGNACEILGDLYFSGKYVEKNYYTAKKYYELGIKYGNINSIEKLSDLYQIEETDFFDVEKSLEVLKNNSNKNIASIFYKIGEIYSRSMYKIFDFDLALENYKKAGALGLKIANEKIKMMRGR